MKILTCVYNAIDFDGRVQRAAEALAELGDVTVVSIYSGLQYTNVRFVSRPVRLPPLKRFRRARHLLYWLALWYRAVKIRPDIIHAHDFFMALPGWIAAKISGARLVYDAHELIIPETCGGWKFREEFWYRCERWVVTRAELVIAANEERGRLMAEHYHLARYPEVIRNIPPNPAASLTDAEVLRRYPPLRRQKGLECLVVYEGDVSLPRGLAAFIAALDFLDDNFRLLIVGAGPDTGKIKRHAAEKGLEHRVLLLGRVPRAHLFDILRLCDIGIVAYPFQGLNNIYCAPNKIFEYAQAGLPVLVTDQPPLRRMVARYGIGELVAEGDPPQKVADCIRKLADERCLYREKLMAYLADHRWESEAAYLRVLFAGIEGV